MHSDNENGTEYGTMHQFDVEEFDVEEAYIAVPLPDTEVLYVRPPVGFEDFWSEGGMLLGEDTPSAADNGQPRRGEGGGEDEVDAPYQDQSCSFQPVHTFPRVPMEAPLYQERS